jgi:hypothetical protein
MKLGVGIQSEESGICGRSGCVRVWQIGCMEGESDA